MYSNEIVLHALHGNLHALNTLDSVITQSRVNKSLKIEASEVISNMRDYFNKLNIHMKIMTDDLEYYKSKYEPQTEKFKLTTGKELVTDILVSEMITKFKNVVYE